MKTAQEVLWTPELAYVVGLLTTDGSLSKDGRHINITSKDIDQLQTFASILSLTNKIGKKTSSFNPKGIYYQIQFGNVNLYRFLSNVGLFPNKSRALSSLKVPDQYFVDFLRGHLDGDGSIVTYIDTHNKYFERVYKNRRLYLKFISASRLHVEWLQKKIFKLTYIEGSVSSDNIWTLKFSKINSVRMLNWIYYKNDLPCLERKRKIAVKVLEEIQNEKRKKYTKRSNLN